MTKTRLKVEGLKNIQAALGDLPKATAKNTLRRVAKDRLKPIQRDAASKAPEDEGDLEASISIGTKLVKSQRRKSKKEKGDIVAFVGPSDLPQAHLQEFGTRFHPPHPFMRPAWDSNKRALLENLAGDLWAEIKKASDRLARKKVKKAKRK